MSLDVLSIRACRKISRKPFKITIKLKKPLPEVFYCISTTTLELEKKLQTENVAGKDSLSVKLNV